MKEHWSKDLKITRSPSVTNPYLSEYHSPHPPDCFYPIRASTRFPTQLLNVKLEAMTSAVVMTTPETRTQVCLGRRWSILRLFDDWRGQRRSCSQHVPMWYRRKQLWWHVWLFSDKGNSYTLKNASWDSRNCTPLTSSEKKCEYPR